MKVVWLFRATYVGLVMGVKTIWLDPSRGESWSLNWDIEDTASEWNILESSLLGGKSEGDQETLPLNTT